jgi:hypothetical protein
VVRTQLPALCVEEYVAKIVLGHARTGIELPDRSQEPLITHDLQAAARNNTGRNILLALLLFLIAVSVVSVWYTGGIH